MSLLEMVGLLPARNAGPPGDEINRGETDDFWYNPASQQTAAGVSVSPDSALTVSVVYACIRILSETVASLPAILYRRLPNGGKERATSHPLYNLLRHAPNTHQSAMEFMEFMMGGLLTRGNAYAEVIPGQRGYAARLQPIHSSRVTVEQLGPEYASALRFQVTHPGGGPPTVLLQNQMMRFVGQSVDGITGLSPVALAREAIGLTQALEQAGAATMKNNSTPPGILQHPGRFSNDDQKRDFLNSWKQALSGRNRGNTALLENGITYQQIGMASRDAQFLESRKFQVEEIARIFRVPPTLLADSNRATFASAEQFILDFVNLTIRPYLVRIESAIRRDLLLHPDEYFVEFLVDALLRGDIKARFEAYGIGITNGLMTRNEARQRENLNPIEGLDMPLHPLNMGGAGPADDPPRGTGRAESFIRDAARRCARRELAALARGAAPHASDADAFAAYVTGFYADWPATVQEIMHVPADAAEAYAATQRETVLEHGLAHVENWGVDRTAAQLAFLALGE